MKKIGEEPIQFHEVLLTDRLLLKPVLIQNLPEYAIDRDMNYMNMFFDNEQVGDNIFRIGGLGGKFKDGYCGLLVYREELYSKDIVAHTGSKERRHLAGHWCIVNEKGKILVETESQFENLHHIGGVLVKMEKRGIVNIETNKIILPEVSGQSLKSDDYYFVEVNYDKDCEHGVYKIEKSTGKYEIFSKK